MRYEPVAALSRQQLIAGLECADPEIVAGALYSAARFELDWEWVQGLCLRELKSPDLTVRWAAATCLGDLALRRFPLTLSEVIPALEAAAKDHLIADPASFSLSMVTQFSSGD